MPAFNTETLTARLELLGENPALWDEKLKEKGIECAVLIPILEIFLGFDALQDIAYEISSTQKNSQRFDLLLQGKFLFEAKSLTTDLQTMTKQIERYITGNDQINYGTLTNGQSFIFFLQREYIEGFREPHQKIIIPIKQAALPVLSLDIADENFQNLIQLFHKECYENTFAQIARYVLAKHHNKNRESIRVITDDKPINEILKAKIDETIGIQRGALLKEIESGKYKPGQIFQYHNEENNVVISVTLVDDGRVKLAKGAAQILNLNQVSEGEFKTMIKLVTGDWGESDVIFHDFAEVIRAATGKRRLSHQENYVFKPVT